MNRDTVTVYTVLFYLFVQMLMSAWLHQVSYYLRANIIMFDIYFSKILKALTSIVQFLSQWHMDRN